MRYFVTAHTPQDKQSLLSTLADIIIDAEPGSRRNILINTDNIENLLTDSRVKDVQPHPDDWPGYELRIF